ncbi:MAG: phycobilisome protein [Leptolyngbyaceae cyanobacterium SM1_1_3]|nr:phycobilisome protein [Leptolyngbyaceae cyanobacterium SM1_1_3]NJN03395.1 phycobilisome protein [Leptolyngbyaceae cyanobacterium RM1_1_2]NJO10450.1 phycobilisome protein [Leptolyngbyaceae cyanobacterium SL_1_1]
MLSQLSQLSLDTDGRYATDNELMFLQGYLKTARLRFGAYQKIQAAEAKIIEQVYQKLKAIDASLLKNGNTDLTQKWKTDTIRILRYAATALLIDDPDTFRERMLLWFQTIMRSFKAERSCNATYVVMQDVVKQFLSPQEAELFCPILEMSREILGQG